MKINFYGNFDKYNKNVLIKKSQCFAFAGGLAFLSLLTGCSDNISINDKYTVNDVINSNKDKTTLDENLSLIKIAPSEDSKEMSWKSVNTKYLKARKNNDIEKCNKYLYVMNKMLLECKLLEALNYNVDDFTSISFVVNKEEYNPIYIATIEYEYSVNQTVPGGLSEEVDVKTVEKYALDGLARDVAINMSRARQGKLDFSVGDADRNTNIDDCYRTLNNFALGDSLVQPNIFGETVFIVNKPGKEKIKSLKLN